MALLVPLSGCLQAPVNPTPSVSVPPRQCEIRGCWTSFLTISPVSTALMLSTLQWVQGQPWNSVGTVMWMHSLFTHRSKKLRLSWQRHANERTPIARNAFVLLGPQAWNGSVFDAFTSILENETCFVSRGDNSGTHAKEQAIWMHINQTLGTPMVEDSNGYHPDGDWYFSIGQGMGAAVNMADEKGCATFSDRGTALQFQSTIDLKRTEFNDPSLTIPTPTSSFNLGMQRPPTRSHLTP